MRMRIASWLPLATARARSASGIFGSSLAAGRAVMESVVRVLAALDDGGVRGVPARSGKLTPMNDRPDKDARLGEDIRLLGRLLGDTIRAYEGEATFNLVEDIRRLAVASRRLEDVASRELLARTLDSLTVEQALAVVRAFSYFSLLANIAEDRHHIRRQRENRRAGSPPLASTLRGLFAEMRERGTRAAAAAAALARIRVYPVLTAHPTEVQRKSNLDCQLAIAQWLARIESADALTEDVDAAVVELRRLVAILWQTRMLRAVRLGVRDEIENALAYFNY